MKIQSYITEELKFAAVLDKLIISASTESSNTSFTLILECRNLDDLIQLTNSFREFLNLYRNLNALREIEEKEKEKELREPKL